MHTQFWWYTVRASGITAWALSAGSLLLGLMLSTRVLGKKPTGPWLLDVHRFTGGLSVIFVGVHLAALVADSYTHFGLADLVVPFVSTWRPAAVALGIVAFYFLLAIEITSLLMRRIPKHWWRAVHLTSGLLYVTASWHLLAAGADARNRLLLAAVWTTSVAAVLLLSLRLLWRSAAPKAPAPRRVLESRRAST
jgi:methionine sulfoxide reductase heme-binding subunit